MTLRTQILLAILTTVSVVAAEPTDKKIVLHSDGGGWKFSPANEVDVALPNVLLIGDSIMNGYRSHVITGLKGKANVDVWSTPVHLNSKGLHEDLSKVASFRHYDVIHFNIGLHGWQPGRIPEGKYSELLKKYVVILKENAPDAKLIWGSTTQVYDTGKQELHKTINATVVERNGLAVLVMEEEGVTVNDLYGLMSDKLHLLSDDGVHWKKPEAYIIMGNQIVELIESKF
jgi:hypothetical protein